MKAGDERGIEKFIAQPVSCTGFLVIAGAIGVAGKESLVKVSAFCSDESDPGIMADPPQIVQLQYL